MGILVSRLGEKIIVIVYFNCAQIKQVLGYVIIGLSTKIHVKATKNRNKESQNHDDSSDTVKVRIF